MITPLRMGRGAGLYPCRGFGPGAPQGTEGVGAITKDEECLTVNLGTGTGYSVLDIVRAFEQASGRSVPYKIAPRRPATLPLAMPIRNGRFSCWAGGRSVGSMRCARMPGAGRVSILTGITRSFVNVLVQSPMFEQQKVHE